MSFTTWDSGGFKTKVTPEVEKKKISRLKKPARKKEIESETIRNISLKFRKGKFLLFIYLLIY